MTQNRKHESIYRKQSETPRPSDRLSRALHRQATVAPPSMVQVTPLASRSKARARLGRPSVADFVQVQWLRSARSASCFALVSFSYRSSWKLVYARQQKGKKPPYCCLSDHPPSPSRGLWRPSNITRDYAQCSCATLPRTSVGCTSPLSAAPHNQRYV